MRIFASIVTVALLAQAAGANEPVNFRKDLAPLLLDQCLACHGPKKAEGGYRVDSFERLLKEGDTGSAGIAPGKLDESELLRRLKSEDAEERMPLEAPALSKEQIAKFEQWIKEGAKIDYKDKKAELASIIPPPKHPDPPEKYPHTMPVTAMVMSPDGKQLITSGYHELIVWEVNSGKLVKRIKNVGQRTHALAFSPDGKLLAVGGGAPGRLGETRFFNPQSGELVKTLPSTSDIVLDLAFSPKGDRIAVGAADGVLRVYEVATAKLQLTITSHSDWVMAVAWNKDGTQLVAGSRDKTAKVFKADNGELVVTYSGHGQPVKGVAFHPDGKEVFSSGLDKKLHRWKVADGKKSAEVAFGGEVFKLNRSGDFLFATSADKTVRQFEAKTHKQVRSFEGHTDWAVSSAVHLPSKRIASGGFDGQIRVWNMDDGKIVSSFVAAPGHK